MQHHKIIYWGIFLYFGFIIAVAFRYNVWLSPDQFLIFGIIMAVLLGRGKSFIRDWLPIIMIFLSYEALHGINPDLTKVHVNITNIIDLEYSLFGQIPTLTLQKMFFDPRNVHWYDIFFSIIYMSHFVGWLVFSFFLWITKHKFFRPFTYALLLLSYAACFTYIVFPVMPPWMASDLGFLPNVHRLMYITAPYYTQSAGGVPSVYHFFAANKVAAIPSLHAAYPVMIFLFSVFLRKKWLILLTSIYALCVWLAVVYLGEHYLIDVVIGVIYALISFWIIYRLMLRAKPVIAQ